MKNIKFIFYFFLSILILSCSNSEEAVSFKLSNDNISGSYNIGSFNINTELSNEITPGIFATFSTAKFVGDTFQIDLELNTNGTYTLAGQYRVVTTVTIVGGSNPTIPPAIINFSDSGTYTIDTSDNSIQFISESGNFLGAKSLDPIYLDTTFSINVFNENSFTMNQEAENTINKIKTKTNSIISFVRK